MNFLAYKGCLMFLFCYVVQMRAVSFKLLLYDVLIYGSSYIYVVIRVTRTHRCCQIFTFHIGYFPIRGCFTFMCAMRYSPNWGCLIFISYIMRYSPYKGYLTSNLHLEAPCIYVVLRDRYLPHSGPLTSKLHYEA